MVVVKIEVWPGGHPEKARTIGVMTVTNDGTGNDLRGNYQVRLSHAGKYFKRRGVYRTGRLNNHIRKLSPYHLIVRAIHACGIR